jgi:hypothetical protein
MASIDLTHGSRPLAGARREPVLAAGLAGAAAAMTAASAHHALEHGWPGYLYMLVAVAAVQALLTAAVLWRPRAEVAFAGIMASTAAIALFAWSHTEGLPWGTHADVALDPHAASVTATVLELALVAVLLAMLPAWLRRWTANALVALALGLWYLRYTNAF